MDHHHNITLHDHNNTLPLIKTIPIWRRAHTLSCCHPCGFTLGENGDDDVSTQPKRRCFQRRKFRSKKRKERWNTSCHRIDLKDWPSDVPLPSTNPTSLRLAEDLFPSTACETTKQQALRCHHHHAQGIYKSDCKTPWDLSLDESGESTTDVGFTTSTVSALSWDYDDLGSNSMSGAVLSETASAGSEIFTPATNSGSRQRNIIICEDRLTTWRKEESSPTFFLLALITILLLTGFLSSSEALFRPQQNESMSLLPVHQPPSISSTMLTTQIVNQSSDHSLPQTKKKQESYMSSSVLDFQDMIPSSLDEEEDAICHKDDSKPKENVVENIQWTTFGVDRRKTTPSRLTVFSVGAAVSLYAWQWF